MMPPVTVLAQLAKDSTGFLLELYLRSFYPDYAPCELCRFIKRGCRCAHIVRGEN